MRERVPETINGIQGELDVSMYDAMMRKLRDKGWLAIEPILDSGIIGGVAFEIGPGPGYLGLEWLKSTSGTKLTALDISPAMLEVAKKNAEEYELSQRAMYVLGNAHELPFPENGFNAVFSNGSLHEWSEPVLIFDEIYRVLKKGGRFCVTDLRRDMNPFIRCFMKLYTSSREMKRGLMSSIRAAYTKDELERIMEKTSFSNPVVRKNGVGLTVTGEKQ